MPCLCDEAGWFLPHSSQSFTISNRNKADSSPSARRNAGGKRQGSRSTIPCCLSRRREKIIVGNVPQNAPGFRDHCMQTNLGDGSNTDVRTHEFAARPTVLRKALEFHKEWIEATLGVGLADIVIFQVDLNFAQIGVETILACFSGPEATSRAVRRLRPLGVSAIIPQGFPPVVELSKQPH
jgi:hypothetical protein